MDSANGVDAVDVDLSHAWSANIWDWPLQRDEELIKIKNSLDKFEVGLRVKFFTQEDIQVRCKDHDVHIICNNDDSVDRFSQIARDVYRVYRLPTDVDMTTLRSRLRNDGLLIIEADKKKRCETCYEPQHDHVIRR